MARSALRILGVLTLLSSLASAQTLSNLPNLSTATRTTSTKSNANNDASSTAANGPVHLTGLPTIAGAGIPSLIIPDTAGAPYMRKSSLPEGTFFIAVGATLAFLGACVLLWRAMIAWSINRSVKRTAMASMGTRSEKTGGSMYGGWTGSRKSSGFNKVSVPSFYKDGDMNSVSMENLTSSGKQMKSHAGERSSTMPQDLFFSPTAHARDSAVAHNRPVSSYMPAGYYASPSAAQPAGGAPNTTIGASLAPYAQQHKRNSTQGSGSGVSRGTDAGSNWPTSRDSATLRGASRDYSRDGPLNDRDSGLRLPSRDGRASHLYANPSSSSLMVGQSSNGSDGTPSRTPSAYMEDLFENHGNGPRERFY